MKPAEVLLGLKDENPQNRYRMLKTLVSKGYSDPDSKVLAQLIRLCKHAKPVYNRLEAMRALRQFWSLEDARKAILDRLEDESYIVGPCIELLGSIGDRPALEALLGHFQKAAKVEVRCQILTALHPVALPTVFQFLRATGAHESEDEKLRAAVVSLLAARKDPNLKPLFMQALGDKSARVRANALEALEAILPKKERAKIFAYCARKDSSNRVQANALLGLLRLGVRQAVPMVEAMLKHRNFLYRSSAAWVLGEIGHRLPQASTWLDGLSSDPHSNVTYRAGLSRRRIEEQLSTPIRSHSAPASRQAATA